MSKERLEEIGKRATHRVLENSRGEVRYRFTEINTEDFDWLIEQAEIGINASKDKQVLIKSNIALNKRVQELEKESAEWEIETYTQKAGKRHLEQQNKRYREALEFYAEQDNYEWEISYRPQQEIDCIVIDDGGHTARKALEGDLE